MSEPASITHMHSVETEYIWGELSAEDFASTMQEFKGRAVRITVEYEEGRHRGRDSDACELCAKFNDVRRKRETSFEKEAGQSLLMLPRWSF